MKAIFRFGSIADYDFVVDGDRSLKSNVVEWKLNHHEIILAEFNQEIVGYLRIEYLWSKYPYIGLIIVNPQNRRQGIGKGMLRFLERHLANGGINSLYSSSQVNEMEPQKWHRKMGFKECGIINGINDGNIGEVFFVKDVSRAAYEG